MTKPSRRSGRGAGKAESYDRDKKVPFYARLGVEWLWLVDVVRRNVEVYQLRDGVFIRIPGALGTEARLPPFEHIALPMKRFWV